MKLFLSESSWRRLEWDPWQRWELNLIRHQRTQRDRRLLPGAGRAQIRKRVFLDTQ